MNDRRSAPERFPPDNPAMARPGLCRLAILATAFVLAGRPTVAQDSETPIPSTRAFDFSDLKAIEIPGPVSEAARHLEEARRQHKAGQWLKAIEEASLAIRLDPEFAEAYRLRSRVYAQEKLYLRAIADLSSLIRINPGDRMSFLFRGYHACEDRDYEPGFADLETAFALSHTDTARAEVYHWRGNARELQGEPGMALVDYQKALELGRETAALRLDRGRAFAKLGDHALAIIELERSIAVGPRPYQDYDLGKSHLALGHIAEARAAFDQAILADPKNSWHHQGRGWARLVGGDADGAIEDFNQALALAPKFAEALAGRGWAYLAKRDIDRAAGDFEAAQAVRPPGKIQVDCGFHKILSLSPDYARSIEEFDRRCREFPNIGWALMSFRGDEARSHDLEYPYLAVYLVCRTRAVAGIAPNLIFRFVENWQTCPGASLAGLGLAIVEVRRSRPAQASEELYYAAGLALKSLLPGLIRPSARDFFGIEGAEAKGTALGSR